MSGSTVILVHGLWMSGVELTWLRQRLEGFGHAARKFSYPTLTANLDTNRRSLREFILGQAGPTALIGHSLGGVLALQTLRSYPELPVTKVICLGSPLVDTAAGRSLQRVEPGRFMLGETLREAVFEQPLIKWDGKPPVGVIAGTSNVGPGNLIAELPKPNDGTVALVETWLPGIADHLALPIGHVAMLFSQEVAEQCHWFLQHGCFKRGAAGTCGTDEPDS